MVCGGDDGDGTIELRMSRREDCEVTVIWSCFELEVLIDCVLQDWIVKISLTGAGTGI